MRLFLHHYVYIRMLYEVVSLDVTIHSFVVMLSAYMTLFQIALQSFSQSLAYVHALWDSPDRDYLFVYFNIIEKEISNCSVISLCLSDVIPNVINYRFYVLNLWKNAFVPSIPTDQEYKEMIESIMNGVSYINLARKNISKQINKFALNSMYKDITHEWNMLF